MRRRNISIFFDGTGQNRSKKSFAEWSNVVLLHDAIPDVNTDGLIQSRKYIDGVGTRPGEDITGGCFGIDLDKRIEEAYEFLYQEVNNAREDGEEPHVYLFGFSRGAYAARWLASLIQFAGIRTDLVSTRKLMQYHKNDYEEGVAALRQMNRIITDVPIEFLGVWDTVEASVNPSFGIENVPAIVNSAFHALAIDEWRYKFKPTRFNASDKVTELWFPGCHTDVGGGYHERALANESLWWIVAGAKNAGLQIDEDKVSESIELRCTELRYHDELYEGEQSWLWKKANRAAGYKGKYFREIRGDDAIHQSVNYYVDNAPIDRQLIPGTCIVLGNANSQHNIEIV